MVKRIKVGINFTYDEDWIGGTYYITNLVTSLAHLPDNQKPHIIVLSWHNKDYELIRQTGYPYVSFLNLSFPLNLFQRAINGISQVLLKRKLINKYLDNTYVDIMFPGNTAARFEKISKKVFWIPDFQEKYYPEFFTSQQILGRKETQSKIVDLMAPIVFSSKSAETDFRKLYPDAKNVLYVLNFAVTHPEFSSISIAQLKTKYNITKRYFMVPNQFWIHKNQKIVVKALCYLKENDDFQVVFTGKESDVRNPDYFNSLKKIVDENGIGDKLRFLGFIDRREQLKLMEGSLAIIQPSLFEGWSTVVEDANAMHKFIILSDLPVHREQISENCMFFDPNVEKDLFEKMKYVLLHVPEMKKMNNYADNVRKFGYDFMKIINHTLK